MNKPSFPRRLGAGRRSVSFQRYLNDRPDLAAELIAAETRYRRSKIGSRGSGSEFDAYERDFFESMRGFEDPPAGMGRN